MEKIIKKKFENDKWEIFIFDGAQPPVTDPIQKNLKRLKKPLNQKDHSIPSSAPIVFTFFFKNGSKDLEQDILKLAKTFFLY